MLPPKDVYSAVFTNATDNEVTLKLTYKFLDDESKEETLKVPAEGTATAEQQTKESNGCTFTYVIANVAVGGHPSAVLQAPFPDVNSPTKDYAITIGEEHGAITLKH